MFHAALDIRKDIRREGESYFFPSYLSLSHSLNFFSLVILILFSDARRPVSSFPHFSCFSSKAFSFPKSWILSLFANEYMRKMGKFAQMKKYYNQYYSHGPSQFLLMILLLLLLFPILLLLGAGWRMRSKRKHFFCVCFFGRSRCFPAAWVMPS